MNDFTRDELERILDAHGLPDVLDALSEIAGEKAAHITASYQDEPLAATWLRAAVYLRLVATRDAIQGVPH